MDIQMQIHEKALKVVKQYKRSESDLIEVIQEADAHRVYSRFKCKNLYEYTMKVLELSESIALNFIAVARKAKEVPELKEVIKSGALSVSKARKITPVLTKSNQKEWLQMAVALPQKKLEQQVAKACPKEAVPEKIKFVSEHRLNLQMGISENLSQKLRRAQDLESQRHKKPTSLEETLEAVLDFYLENEDPLVKSDKLKARKNLSVSRQIDLRDGGQCTFLDESGKRCEERRWLDVHHVIPKSRGGLGTFENLTTLCSGHHRMTHSYMNH